MRVSVGEAKVLVLLKVADYVVPEPPREQRDMSATGPNGYITK